MLEGVAALMNIRSFSTIIAIYRIYPLVLKILNWFIEEGFIGLDF
jgi:hypothetical protein